MKDTVQEEEKKELLTKERKIFIGRLTAYVIFGALIPFFFLVWRFNLFQPTTKLSVGGWGIVAVLFITIFFAKLLKQVGRGMEFSVFLQTVEGYSRVVLPLIAAILCIYCARDYLKEIMQFLGVVAICEAIAIPCNPLPAWINSKNIEKEESKFTKFVDIFWGRKKD